MRIVLLAAAVWLAWRLFGGSEDRRLERATALQIVTPIRTRLVATGLGGVRKVDGPAVRGADVVTSATLRHRIKAEIVSP